MKDTISIFLMTTLGESILVETMKSACYFLTHSNNVPKHRRDRSYYEESKQCYFFMQGTGIDILIETYALDYDPNTLRESFNYYVRQSV